MARSIDVDLPTQLSQFIGYGPSPKDGRGAQILFLGIEEAAGEGEEGKRNLHCRAREYQPIEDLLEAHRKLRAHKCFDPFSAPAAKNPVRVWNMMSRIALALADDPHWNRMDRWNWYWRRRLGRSDGETFLMECFPIPRPGRNHTVSEIPGWHPEKVWPARRQLLQAFIASSPPQYLIAYGNEPGRLVEQLLGDTRLTWTPIANTKSIEVARAPSGTIVARTGFFGWGRFRRSDVPLLRNAMIKLGGGPIRLPG